MHFVPYRGTTESQRKLNLISIIRDFTSSSDTNKDCVELVEVERVGLLMVNTWSMVSPLHLPAPPPATVSLSFKRLLQGGPSMMWFLASASQIKESGNPSRVESQYKDFWQNLVATFCQKFLYCDSTLERSNSGSGSLYISKISTCRRCQKSHHWQPYLSEVTSESVAAAAVSVAYGVILTVPAPISTLMLEAMLTNS